MLDKSGQRKRRSVSAGGNESSQDSLGEVRSGSSGEESEELKNLDKRDLLSQEGDGTGSCS